MIAHLEYTLPDDNNAFEAAINGDKWQKIALEYHGYITNECSKDTCSCSPRDLLEKLKEVAYNHGITL